MQQRAGTSIIAAFLFGSVAALTMRYHNKRRRTENAEDQYIVPQLEITECGRIEKLERFSHYVARQMGFTNATECPRLCKLAYDYLRKTKDCEDSIYEFFASEKDADALYVKLIEELERCIMSYFAFHWSKASLLIGQVVNSESGQKRKLKEVVLAATRKLRFERVTKHLKVTRIFSTLVEEIKAIKGVPNDKSRSDVMVPAALCDRSPVLLFMGGGMGAGKSTVIKHILQESFWLGAASNAVVVEADAFKESDVIYQALSSIGHHHDMVQTAELVHKSSVHAASSLLVTALNQGRDVIMDGTLSWEPFVEQTIAMARNVHKHRYMMGPGYKVAEDGTTIEDYWEPVKEEENKTRRPYRIELVGVVCDAYLAVIRGIRRAIITGRAVRVNSQLESHKRFANAFPNYCQLVDNARLYSTNVVGGLPRLIAWKDGNSNLLVDSDEFNCLSEISKLNENAESVYELYEDQGSMIKPGSLWRDFILTPTRVTLQQELKTAIQKIQDISNVTAK